MNHWLLKSDPETYDWHALLKEKRTAWTGVRNFQARNFLRAMKKGDQAFFYHSQLERAIVGTVEIVSDPYPDPTAGDEDWTCVDIAPLEAWDNPVSLDHIRSDHRLQDLILLKQSRLSVSPVDQAAWDRIQGLRS